MDLINLIDPTILEHWAEQALSHQFTQMTIAFALAAWIHSKLRLNFNVDQIFNANSIGGLMINLYCERISL